MVVQHNISAMTANRYYGINNSQLGKSLEKLASGYAINRAGDNAAGLAVSEKMRAQIGGLTQASKNAEDGISMVQTFEGALQETDSILQRMRTLAVQSANGTYQDDVDRDAIQLEFDQLNDELNQIADTDFNGVIMLNGGTMADGLRADAKTGSIDYNKKQAQIIGDAKAKGAEDLQAADAALTAAKANIKATNWDLSGNGGAPEWNDLDNNAYDKAEADAVWTALGIVDDNGDADVSDINTVTITFTYDGTSKWEASKGVDNNGHELDDTALAGLTTTEATNSATVTGKGGFTVDGTSVNAIFDATKAKKGDTVTLTFKNDTEDKFAPTNAGYDANSKKVTSAAAATVDVTEDDLGDITMGDVADADMDAAMKAAFDALEGAEIELTYEANTDPTVKIKGAADTTASNATNNATITLKGKDADGNEVSSQYKIGLAGDKLTIKNKDGSKTLLEVGLGAKDTDKAGVVKGNISISTSENKEASSITVTVGKNDSLDTSDEATEMLNTAQKKYQAVKDSVSKIVDFESAKAYLSEGGVSVSDAFDQSRAKMTYTDQMSLQVGARTKDIVNFTFSYNSDDLGGLEKNLDCSSREGGLNTANLSLKTAKDANNAIDQIDKALNKVNMVRATFGAVQNRLEHKISNIDTNAENMTAAESRIRDTQMDKEMMKFTSAQILSQASQSMLAQANSLPQGVLQLLG